MICTAAPSVQMRLDPQDITAGEEAGLILSAQVMNPPEIMELPKISGIRWLGSSTSIRQQIINGRHAVSAERKYVFIAEKPGSFTIPELTVQVNNKKEKTAPLKFSVKKASLQTGDAQEKSLDIDKVVFSQILFPEKRGSYYVGEYIPLEIRVYCLAGIKVSLGYPQITSDKDDIVYKNYKSVNPENPQFDTPRRELQKKDGKEYICYIFRTEIKIIAAGKQGLRSQTPTRINIPVKRSSRSSRDPFFDDFFGMQYSYRTINHSAISVTPELNIKPLPPMPKDVNWLGLTGNWNVTPGISEKSAKVGTALTFSLQISGNGGLENLQAPDLKINNFRMYAPEITKNENQRSAVIRYTMIPTKAGKLPISEKFCTFNISTGNYSITPFEQVITVETNPGVIPISNKTNVVDSAIPEPTQEDGKEHSPAGIMYLKPVSDSDQVQNDCFWGWFIGILSCGILSLIFCEILAYFLRGSSHTARRKAAAKKQKKALMKELKHANSEKVYDLAPQISEYINNALDLSPGTSLDESAEKLDQNNPELAQELKNISAGAWMPNATVYSEERKKNLMKLLTKLFCLVICFTGCALSAAELQQQDAVKAYDSGAFRKAGEWYTQLLEKQGATPALLYNIGNCYFQEKEFAKALFCYERAHLLAPRDAEILRNLELTRRELNLPSGNQLNTPADIPEYLRDQLTPEEWMILAAAGCAILLLSFGLRRFFNKKLTIPLAAASGILLLLGAVMTINQVHTTYAKNRALILENNIRLRTLPSEKSTFLNDDELNSAEQVEIRERRNKWIRIRAGNAIGWVPADAVGQLNGRKFTVF